VPDTPYLVLKVHDPRGDFEYALVPLTAEVCDAAVRRVEALRVAQAAYSGVAELVFWDEACLLVRREADLFGRKHHPVADPALTLDQNLVRQDVYERVQSRGHGVLPWAPGVDAGHVDFHRMAYQVLSSGGLHWKSGSCDVVTHQVTHAAFPPPKPSVVVFVAGGVVQGARATAPVSLEVEDFDDVEGSDLDRAEKDRVVEATEDKYERSHPEVIY
jgi:hypothetical protein